MIPRLCEQVVDLLDLTMRTQQLARLPLDFCHICVFNSGATVVMSGECISSFSCTRALLRAGCPCVFCGRYDPDACEVTIRSQVLEAQ